MYHVKTMNKISKIGLAELDDRFEISDTMEHEDAILVRSAKLHDYDFPAELLCIARAGAGVNNIPLDRAAEAGIVVFNTPGANANGVKELTIAALLLGLVLGVICESNLRRAYTIAAGNSLWEETVNILSRPVTGIILIICLVVLLNPVVKPLIRKKKS